MSPMHACFTKGYKPHLVLCLASGLFACGPDEVRRDVIEAEGAQAMAHLSLAPRAASAGRRTLVSQYGAADAAILQQAVAGLALQRLASNLAPGRAATGCVREYAAHTARMSRDSAYRIAQWAAAHDVRLDLEPSASALEIGATLAQLSGPDFDAAYLKVMLDRLAQAAQEAQAAADNAQDAQVQGFVQRSVGEIDAFAARTRSLSTDPNAC